VLYGRDAERALIGALLDAARASRSGTLVLRGEPGVGKTALLEDARERAADMHVLTARGVESESELPFAGLHQLTRPALHLIERLPGPQAGALQGALGLAERAGDDRFLISAACLTLLAELAERRPVLCLIDDAQWLDRSSTDALLFVARRLDAEGVVMLFAAREGDVHSFEARGLSDLELRGLDAEAAAAVIAHGADGDVAPSVRDLVIEQAHGNALALVELPSALSAAQLAGTESLPDALPLPRDVERLFRERVSRLPEATQRLLSLIAADDTGLLEPLMRAAEALGIPADALSAAEHAGLVSVDGPSVNLRHPLVRSAVYHGLSSSERRGAHLALADALDEDREPDQRAWHLAAAAVGPDSAVADELEDTAERARLRSGHAAAASALERAAELSVDSASEARRMVAAANAAWHAGQPERATALLDRVTPVISDAWLRADVDHLRGVIQFWCGALLDACAILNAGARAAAPRHPRKALEMLFDAGEAAGVAGDFGRVAEVARHAGSLPRSESREDAFLVDLQVAMASLLEGKSARNVPLAIDVIAQAEDHDEPRWLMRAAGCAGLIGDEATEAALLRRAVSLARTSGAVDMLSHALVFVTVTGLLGGRYGVAAEAMEGLTLAREAGLPNAATVHLAALSWLAAVKGEDGECRTCAREVNESARIHGAGFANAIAEWGVALLDLSRGHADDAVTRLAAVSEARPGVGHAFVALASAADLVEACVRAGRDDAARAAYVGLDGFARTGAPAWALALAARCRALLSQDAAAVTEREFAEALRLHSEANRPFDRARTELLLGEHLRRRRRRVESREHLRAALEAFEALGAAPWADRARAELRASGETARKREPSTLTQLTPQELQVARFVAQGLSNKEVAAQLFLSPRTIDAHLRSVFAKLDITSRTQLARLPLGAEETAREAGAAASVA
jgi:DNA-binding CsgD family transcriptional regulator